MSWTAIIAGLTSTTVLALAIDPVTPARLCAGTLGGGAFNYQQWSLALRTGPLSA